MPDDQTILPPHRPGVPPPEATRGQKIAWVLLGLALFSLGVWTLHDFLPALAWATIFAIAIWPLYRRTQTRFPPGRHNILLPFLFTLVVALIFLVPLVLAVVQFGQDAHGVIHWAYGVQQNGMPPPDWLGKLPFGSAQATQWWQDNLASPGSTSDMLRNLNRSEIMSYSRHFGGQLLHRAVLFGFTLMTLFFLFREGADLTTQMIRASGRAFGPRGERVGQQIVSSVHGTVDGLVLVGLGEGVLLGIAYAIAGVPHPALFGAITAVTAMIPFGAPIAYGVASLILLTQGAVAWAIAIFAFGSVVLVVADHVVRPALIGGATRLPFLWVLFGILGGVEVWGLLGLFLGPAIMSALILLWRELADPAPTP